MKDVSAGPVTIFLGHVNYLLPHYFLFNALILSKRTVAEWAFRNGILQAQIVSGLIEILWVARYPQGLSSRLCAGAAAVASVTQCLHVVLAFCASSHIYGSRVALLLHAIVSIAQIPVTQIGSNYTLQMRISPARYRILGWLTAVVLAVAVLLFPIVASLYFVLPLAVMPLLMAACALFFCGQDTCTEVRGKAVQSASERQPEVRPEHVCAGVREAAMFVFLGLATGTIGEALTDMATTLAIRKSLKAGHKELALTNQMAIFVSMSLAYLSEVRPTANVKSKAFVFIIAWTLCQVFRVFALQHLESGSGSVVVLAGMVFLDKYTGPLGAAALDVALLGLLTEGAERRRVSGNGVFTIPGTLLWTLRTIVARMERPICQLILLHSANVQVEILSSSFTMATALGVAVVLYMQEVVFSTKTKGQ